VEPSSKFQMYANPESWGVPRCVESLSRHGWRVTLLGARSRGPDGSLGRCNASAAGSPLVHDEKSNNPANAVVEIRGRVSFTLANSLPQSANDEFSVRSRVRIVESSDGQFGTSKFKELQLLGPSLEGGYTETVATESYEVGTANDYDR
jgi:hypothetical protein